MGRRVTRPFPPPPPPRDDESTVDRVLLDALRAARTDNVLAEFLGRELLS